jgi:hypothetical protein
MCIIFLETKNCILDAYDTDTCHIKALSILEKYSLNTLKTLNNYDIPVSVAHLHGSDFVNSISNKTNTIYLQFNNTYEK